jgi:hypothetical protein
VSGERDKLAVKERLCTLDERYLVCSHAVCADELLVCDVDEHQLRPLMMVMTSFHHFSIYPTAT